MLVRTRFVLKPAGNFWNIHVSRAMISTPAPKYVFSGGKPGDAWFICAARWLEAYEKQMATKVYLKRTRNCALEIVSIHVLKQYSVDLH